MKRISWLTMLALIVATCGGSATTTTPGSTTTSLPQTTSSTADTTTTSMAPTTTEAEPAGYVAYLLLDELEEEAGGPFLVPVHRLAPAASNAAQQAMELLLAGPSEGEREGLPAISTAIPAGTRALGGSVSDGVVTINLSGEYDDGGGSSSMFARLAQVVYTLTALPGIVAVDFEIDGEPVTVFSAEGIELIGPQQRDDYYDLLPAIFVDSPAWGEPVTSPITVSGLSNVFEAVSQVMLTDDDGLPLFEETVIASCGTGCWGSWQVEIPYTVDRQQFGALIVWEYSAKDGTRIHVREYPVQLR